MECVYWLPCSLASSWVLPIGWPRRRTEWGGESKVVVFIHHHSPFSPNPSHPEAFLQVSTLSVTSLSQILITAVFSYPFGSGSGNNSMLWSSGNHTIPVVALHPPHTMENCAFITPSLDSTSLSVLFPVGALMDTLAWGSSYVWRVTLPASHALPGLPRVRRNMAPKNHPLPPSLYFPSHPTVSFMSCTHV